MKTDELVTLLATGDVAVKAHAAARRFSIGLGAGLLGATLLMLGLLGLRPDLAQAVMLPMFWVKLGFAGAMVVVSLVASLRLARPGARLNRLPVALASPILAIWLLAAFALGQTPAGQRLAMLLGETWAVCPFLIAMLSVPIFAATMWIMRGLAPTNLPLAGASAGLLSGSLAALVYCLHCPEMSAPFIGTWYLLGMLIPTAIGALLGNRLLRW